MWIFMCLPCCKQQWCGPFFIWDFMCLRAVGKGKSWCESSYVILLHDQVSLQLQLVPFYNSLSH